jgi:hypothetical protein
MDPQRLSALLIITGFLFMLIGYVFGLGNRIYGTGEFRKIDNLIGPRNIKLRKEIKR